MGTRPSKSVVIVTATPGSFSEPNSAVSHAVFIQQQNIQSVYSLKHVVGSGFFGNVRLAVRSDGASPIQYAVKSIDKEKVINRYLLDRELESLHQVDHPNIIRLYEVYEDDLYIHLVMELCTGGELFDRILQKQRFSEESAATLMHKILHAVNHLHSLKISHRDLKAEHILFSSESEESEVKLIDFGLAFKYSEDSEMHSMVGTPYYVAPEVLNKKYGPECDIWSLGVILYFLLSGCPPFYGTTRNDIYRKILIGEVSYKDKVWNSISTQAKDLINRMLCKKPENRITAAEAMEHPWFNQMAPVKPSDTKVLKRLTRFKKTSVFREEILSLVARCVDADELRSLNNSFRTIDRDHDGDISMDDLQTALAKTIPQHRAQELFRQIGPSSDGRLNYSDFLRAAMNRRILLDKEVRWMTFKFFDMENNGVITVENIQAALQKLEVYASYSEVQQMILDAGLSVSDPLDFIEFCKVLEPLPEELSSEDESQEPDLIISVPA